MIERPFAATARSRSSSLIGAIAEETGQKLSVSFLISWLPAKIAVKSSEILGALGYRWWHIDNSLSHLVGNFEVFGLTRWDHELLDSSINTWINMLCIFVKHALLCFLLGNRPGFTTQNMSRYSNEFAILAVFALWKKTALWTPGGKIVPDFSLLNPVQCTLCIYSIPVRCQHIRGTYANLAGEAPEIAR